MTTNFPTASSAYGLNGPSAAVTVEKSIHASHTEILTPPRMFQDQEFASFLAKLFRFTAILNWLDLNRPVFGGGSNS